VLQQEIKGRTALALSDHLSTTKSEGMWKIESKHINLRTRIKRLVRRTIGFSKTTTMHDLVIGLFINRYECGLLI
jgi:insertion element IS1 protein InsB